MGDTARTLDTVGTATARAVGPRSTAMRTGAIAAAAGEPRMSRGSMPRPALAVALLLAAAPRASTQPGEAEVTIQ